MNLRLCLLSRYWRLLGNDGWRAVCDAGNGHEVHAACRVRTTLRIVLCPELYVLVCILALRDERIPAVCLRLNCSTLRNRSGNLGGRRLLLGRLRNGLLLGVAGILSV